MQEFPSTAFEFPALRYAFFIADTARILNEITSSARKMIQFKDILRIFSAIDLDFYGCEYQYDWPQDNNVLIIN